MTPRHRLFGGGPDTLWGGPGCDALAGNRGEGTIDGGPGNDYAVGGGGGDVLWGCVGCRWGEPAVSVR